MIDAVWKLNIFVSMLSRITKASRNERVTLRVHNTYPTSVRCTHVTHPDSSVILAHTLISMSGVTVSTVAAVFLCKSGVLLCPSRNPSGSSHKGLGRGTVQATDRKSDPHDHPVRSICAEVHLSTADVSMKMRGCPILLQNEVLWFIFMLFREEPCL
jgi:hypothetical protein